MSFFLFVCLLAFFGVTCDATGVVVKCVMEYFISPEFVLVAIRSAVNYDLTVNPYLQVLGRFFFNKKKNKIKTFSQSERKFVLVFVYLRNGSVWR